VSGLEGMGGNNVTGSLSLLQRHSFDSLETHLTTSVSSKSKYNKTESLATVLEQALVSEDNEALDWILATKDLQTIHNTVGNLKEQRHISALFKQILYKF
jgi:hypothetical protein